MNCSEFLNVFLRLNYIASGWLTRPSDQFRLTSHLPMKMTCSFREGEVHFKWNTFVDTDGLKGSISTVTLEIYLLFFRLFSWFDMLSSFCFKIMLFILIFYTWNICLHFEFLGKKCYTWNGPLCLCDKSL